MIEQSGVINTFSSWQVFLPWHETKQDASDWVKLGGIDEWVDTDVKISGNQRNVVAILIKCKLAKICKEKVYI